MAKLSLAQLAQIPPTWLCTQEAFAGNPVSVSQIYHRIRGAQQLDCFGLRWNVNPSPPAGYGAIVTTGGTEFDRDVLTLTEIVIDSSAQLLFREPLGTRKAQGLFMFSSWPLNGLAIQFAPGVSADLYWMVVFT